jgi:hypothetical protein
MRMKTRIKKSLNTIYGVMGCGMVADSNGFGNRKGRYLCLQQSGNSHGQEHGRNEQII